MKKLIIISVFMVIASSLFAQQKGDMVVSGSLSYSTTNLISKEGSTSTVQKGKRSFTILPSFEYFVCNKLAVGLGLGYSLEKEPNGQSDQQDQLFDKNGMFIIQPMVNYYIGISDKFYYVPGIYAGVGFGKVKSEINRNSTEDYNYTAFSLGLSIVRFEYKPVDKIGISFSCGELNYTAVTQKEDDVKNSNRNFNLNLNVAATVGFNYYF